jgi:cytochrome c peroxidase
MSTLALAAPAGWNWHLPAGVGAPPVPLENPMTAAKVELGRRLFHEADLSINGTMSCGTCHSQRHGFADDNRTRPGVHGDPGRRNVPGLINVAWMGPLTWADPRQRTLEQQVEVPVLGERPVEMGMKGHESEIAARLGRNACYVKQFRAAFPEAGGEISLVHVARALAAFERTLISFNTPFDDYRRGKIDALSPAATRGADLFEGRGGCVRCHSGPNFTDLAFHAIAAPVVGSTDPGLVEITGIASDVGRFRTPGLRNVALTAPYMHDGAVPTLLGAIEHHTSAGALAELSDRDREDLSEFLGALSDERFIADPQFAMPERACGKRL